MKNLLIIAMLLIQWSLIAQNHDLSKSNSGYLFTQGDSLYGRITIDMGDNSALVKQGNSLNHFSAKQIVKISYFDSQGDFKTLIGGLWGEDSEAILFETLVDGEIPLLYKEGLRFSKYDSETYPPYFVKKDGHIYSLGNRKSIIKLLAQDKSSVSFLKSSKLKMKDKTDYMLLFSHVNGVQIKDTRPIAVDED